MINKDKSKKTSHVHSEEVVNLYKSLTKTIILMVVTAFTLVFVAVAWFVANSRVNSGTSQITTVFEPIKLAVSSRDVRQKTEIDVLKLSDGTELQDSEGKTYRDENGNSFYYTNAETIALRLDKNDYEVSPGSKGKIEFYVIPSGGTSKITLDITLGAYGTDEKDQIVKPIDNPALTTMMTGHILFFDDYKNGVYSNWLLKNDANNNWTNTITVNLTGKEVGIPVKVDLYWIWPIRYENMANDFRGTGVNAFAETQALNQNLTEISNNYHYSYVFLTDKQDLSSADVRSEGYDLADEYIGSNAQYLYLKIQTGNEGDQS